MLWDDSADADWSVNRPSCLVHVRALCKCAVRQAQPCCRDEAMHACCAAAEAKLPSAGSGVGSEARRQSLAARPVLGQLHDSKAEAKRAAGVQNPASPPSAPDPALAGPSDNPDLVKPRSLQHQALEKQLQQQQQQQQQHGQHHNHEQTQRLEQAVLVSQSPAYQPAGPEQLSVPKPGLPVHQQLNAGQHLVPLSSSAASQPLRPQLPHQPSLAASHSFPQHSRLDTGVKGTHAGRGPAALTAAAGQHSRGHASQNGPLTFQDIQNRARHFAKQMHLLPPLAPRHSRHACKSICPFLSLLCMHIDCSLADCLV